MHNVNNLPRDFKDINLESLPLSTGRLFLIYKAVINCEEVDTGEQE